MYTQMISSICANLYHFRHKVCKNGSLIRPLVHRGLVCKQRERDPLNYYSMNSSGNNEDLHGSECSNWQLRSWSDSTFAHDILPLEEGSFSFSLQAHVCVRDTALIESWFNVLCCAGVKYSYQCVCKYPREDYI